MAFAQRVIDAFCLLAAMNDRKLDRANWDSFSWNSDVDVVRLAHIGRMTGTSQGLSAGGKVACITLSPQ